MKRSKHKNITKCRRLEKNLAAVCCVMLTSSLLLAGCGQQDTDAEAMAEKDTSILVEVTTPATESISLEGEFMGTVEADTETTVVPKISGEVTATYFEEGDMVAAGDLLFTIDDTSAQISMTQAQASLESAQASVNSATVGEQTAQFNLLYTQAQIEETLGTVDTNQMQLENQVASTKYALKAAEENRELSKEQFGLAADSYKDLEDNMDDLADDAKQMEKYANSLKSYQRNFNTLKNSTDAGQTLQDQFHLTLGDLGLVAGATNQEVAEAYLKEMTGAATEYELGVMVSSAESSASGMRSSRSSLNSSKDSVRLNQISAAVSAEVAKDNVLQAEDAKRLAEKMLADYENYTKATIMAGANASLASANSSLASAQAGVSQAQAGVKQAQASVAQAQLQLDYAKVTSPVSGVVTRKNIDVHNMAQAGASAYLISSQDSINVSFYVSEKVMKSLSEGQKIKVERNGEEYQAVLTENVGVADADSGLFEIKAQVTDGAGLITGTSVKLTLDTERADNVMTVPVDSVYYESKTAYVYCMADNKAVKTPIETGLTNNESVEVTSGLTQDSKIITSWASQLRDGSEVRLKDESAAASGSGEENTADEDGADEADEETAGDGDSAAVSVEGEGDAEAAADYAYDFYVTAGAARTADAMMQQ